METGITVERIFSLSCIEGLRLIRKHAALNPKLKSSALLSHIDLIEPAANTLDMEASIYLSNLVEDPCPLEGHEFYHACIKAILIKYQPIWAKLMRQGRLRFVKKLNSNEQDVFAAAGLLEKPIPLSVVAWWDNVSGYSRLISDQEKINQGRKAEILTLDYERERLKKIGINKEPEWLGLDDNFAGYDVLSYDHGQYDLVNKLIEVKSTLVSPLRFILTLNEWETAKKAKTNYTFHIWNMRTQNPELHKLTVDEVEKHIPLNKGNGKWTHVVIPVSSN